MLFDLDRTLVDVQSYTDYAAAMVDVEAVIGGWRDVPTPSTGWDAPTRRAMDVLVALSGDVRWQRISDLIERHELAAVERASPMTGLRAALQRTRHRRRAVVTLLPEGAATAVMQRFEIDIDVLIPRRSDLAPKPAPDQLEAALRFLRASPAESVMVGDSTWDAAAARAAGCRFVGVTNGGPDEFGEGAVAVDLLEAVALL